MEDWSGALRRVAADPHGILLVVDEPMGIVAEQACAIEFPALRNCPVRTIVLDEDLPFDGWAHGLFEGELVKVADVRARLRPDDQVYTFNHIAYDPLLKLSRKNRLLDGTVFNGPISPKDLVIETPLPQKGK